ncbi:hypothetical protein [Streptomyces sp. NBC_00572]|uniref:hypothetical protein n=1 Tax=Streptomyces sp. NBC_00572 TaxID=2903664 RepID=UPI00224EBA50|nr:hypothetical protein [Streptomyces sp. NBC_00572]MCX4982272.1 hypothetical protein [Streptomyces sp. NBC_00572]
MPHLPKLDPATLSTALSAAFSTAKLAAADGRQDAGPVPVTAQRRPLRELPRTGHRGAPAATRNRIQAPRRTY